MLLFLSLCFFLFHSSTSSTAAATAATSTCWSPNHAQQSSDYVPCNLSAAHSMCCATWDQCNNTTGLCWNEAYQLWWRESCTDPTWQDDACMKLFLTLTDSDIPLTNCADGSWCPFTNSSSVECCNNGEGVFLNGTSVAEVRAAESASAAASASASGAKSTITPSSTSTSSAAQETTSSAASPLSTGAIAGIAVGAAAGAACVIGRMVLLCLRRRRLRHHQPPNYGTYVPAPAAEGQSTPAVSEIGTEQPEGFVEVPSNLPDSAGKPGKPGMGMGIQKHAINELSS